MTRPEKRAPDKGWTTRRSDLDYGEPAAAAGMKQAITEGLGWKVEIAEWMQKVEVA